MARRRGAARGRRAAGRSTGVSAPHGPSVMELALYGAFATVIAAVMLILNGRPWWHAAVVVLGAGISVGVLTIVAARPGPEMAENTDQVRRRRRR